MKEPPVAGLEVRSQEETGGPTGKRRRVSHRTWGPLCSHTPLPTPASLTQLTGRTQSPLDTQPSFPVLLYFGLLDLESVFFPRVPKQNHFSSFSSHFFPDNHQDQGEWISTQAHFPRGSRKPAPPSSPTRHTGEGVCWGCPLVTRQFLKMPSQKWGAHKSADDSPPKEEEADWLQTLSAPIHVERACGPHCPSPTLWPRCCHEGHNHGPRYHHHRASSVLQ